MHRTAPNKARSANSPLDLPGPRRESHSKLMAALPIGQPVIFANGSVHQHNRCEAPISTRVAGYFIETTLHEGYDGLSIFL